MLTAVTGRKLEENCWRKNIWPEESRSDWHVRVCWWYRVKELNCVVVIFEQRTYKYNRESIDGKSINQNAKQKDIEVNSKVRSKHRSFHRSVGFAPTRQATLKNGKRKQSTNIEKAETSCLNRWFPDRVNSSIRTSKNFHSRGRVPPSSRLFPFPSLFHYYFFLPSFLSLFCRTVPVSSETDATRLRASYESLVPIAIEGRSKPRARASITPSRRKFNSRSFLTTVARPSWNYVKLDVRNSAWLRVHPVTLREFMQESWRKRKEERPQRDRRNREIPRVKISLLNTMTIARKIFDRLDSLVGNFIPRSSSTGEIVKFHED